MFPDQRETFFYVLVVGIVVLSIFLLCRECFNWYIKHNSMLDELKKIKR